jgi:ketosteroid isomerase-like protein
LWVGHSHVIESLKRGRERIALQEAQMDDHNVLETIGRFWQARVEGDKAAVLSFLSKDATYELVGASDFSDPVTVGPAAVAEQAADRLMDDFRFHSLEQLDTVVDGRKAAVVNRLQVSFRGGAPVTTDVCDLWEFDEVGKVRSLRQFVDTRLVHRMMGGAA